MVKYNVIRVLSALLLLTVPCFVSAQNLRENQRKAQAIQNESQRYLWGFGDGANVNEATQNAKQDLLTSISAKVESNQTSTMRNVQNGQDVQTEMEDMNVIKIKAAGQLKGTHVLILANPPQCRVMAYMEKVQLDSTYQARRQRVVQHCIDAQNAEKLG
ncbi:MAG: LPP20 family lipoprotein [Bacteroidaceae bacterium]|nr:LPP20 family lipoprotein [Bacteroidaceae bacterium]